MTTELISGIIAVEVPEGWFWINSSNARIEDNPERGQWLVLPESNAFEKGFKLPVDGYYNIAGIYPSITEKECKGIVDWFSSKYGSGYKDYVTGKYDPIYAYDSLQSLLQSKGLSTEKRYVILTNKTLQQ